jgi:hypothetical protein
MANSNSPGFHDIYIYIERERPSVLPISAISCPPPRPTTNMSTSTPLPSPNSTSPNPHASNSTQGVSITLSVASSRTSTPTSLPVMAPKSTANSALKLTPRRLSATSSLSSNPGLGLPHPFVRMFSFKITWGLPPSTWTSLTLIHVHLSRPIPLLASPALLYLITIVLTIGVLAKVLWKPTRQSRPSLPPCRQNSNSTLQNSCSSHFLPPICRKRKDRPDGGQTRDSLNLVSVCYRYATQPVSGETIDSNTIPTPYSFENILTTQAPLRKHMYERTSTIKPKAIKEAISRQSPPARTRTAGALPRPGI